MRILPFDKDDINNQNGIVSWRSSVRTFHPRHSFLFIFQFFLLFLTTFFSLLAFSFSSYSQFSFYYRDWGSQNHSRNQFCYSSSFYIDGVTDDSRISNFVSDLSDLGGSTTDDYVNFLSVKDKSLDGHLQFFSLFYSGNYVDSVSYGFVSNFGLHSSDAPERMNSIPIDRYYTDGPDLFKYSSSSSDGISYITDITALKILSLDKTLENFDDLLGKTILIKTDFGFRSYTINNILLTKTRSGPKILPFMGNFLFGNDEFPLKEGVVFVFGSYPNTYCCDSLISTIQPFSKDVKRVFFVTGPDSPVIYSHSEEINQNIYAANRLFSSFSVSNNLFFSLLLVSLLLSVLISFRSYQGVWCYFGIFQASSILLLFGIMIAFFHIFVPSFSFLFFSPAFGLFLFCYLVFLAFVCLFSGKRHRLV
jgi:hypothetical protein